MKTIKFTIFTALTIIMMIGYNAKMNAQTNCGGTFTTIASGTNWTATTTYSGQHLFIAGNVTVTATTVTFDNCDIIMANGASITMSGSSSSVLTITNFTHIYACGTDMWAGID